MYALAEPKKNSKKIGHFWVLDCPIVDIRIDSSAFFIGE